MRDCSNAKGGNFRRRPFEFVIMVRNCAPENLEIPGLVLRTIPE